MNQDESSQPQPQQQQRTTTRDADDSEPNATNKDASHQNKVVVKTEAKASPPVLEINTEQQHHHQQHQEATYNTNNDTPQPPYREVTQPQDLEAIVAQNPVLRDIRAAGAHAKREDVYPADSTAEYVYRYLQHFPPNTYALPQSFRKVIKGLHAGHWLSKKIDELKNRRWRTTTTTTTTTIATTTTSTTESSPATSSSSSPYGKLSMEEATELQRCNAAFWELYIQQKPPVEVLKKRQEQYDKKKAHNSRFKQSTTTTSLPSSSSTTTTTTTTKDAHGNADADADTTIYHEVVDPNELEAIVQQNPVLRDIRLHGAAAKREDVYPADSTADYVYTFLENFPNNSFALPQTFRKVIKGLHAGHWLSKKIEEIKNRRWRTYHIAATTGGGSDDGSTTLSGYGKLSMEEAQKLQRCNMAFWQTYIQKKPSEDVIRKRQEQYEKKTAHNKSSRSSLSSLASVEHHPAVPIKSEESTEEMGAIAGESLLSSNNNNNKADIIHHAPTTESTTDKDSGNASTDATTTTTKYTEIIDPTAMTRLELIVRNNPVLLKIREYGPTAKREDVFPTNR
eukprot:scaffold34695_cov266-Amphora_coffeaeformis.AAC.3